jgi:ketosteroid isomerase-like protein
MSQENIGIVQNGYAAFGRGDIPGLLSLLDDNVEWKTPGAADLPTAGTRRGRAEVGDFFRGRRLRDRLDDLGEQAARAATRAAPARRASKACA